MLQRAVRDVRAVTPPLCVTTVPAGTPWWTERPLAHECAPVSTRRPFSRRTTTRLPTGQGVSPNGKSEQVQEAGQGASSGGAHLVWGWNRGRGGVTTL